MLEYANTENCRQATLAAVGSTNIVFDKTAIIVHMLEDPGIATSYTESGKTRKLAALAGGGFCRLPLGVGEAPAGGGEPFADEQPSAGASGGKAIRFDLAV